MQNIMRDLVEIIAKSLVDNPELVTVKEISGEQSIILELKVAPEDISRIVAMSFCEPRSWTRVLSS